MAADVPGLSSPASRGARTRRAVVGPRCVCRDARHLPPVASARPGATVAVRLEDNRARAIHSESRISTRPFCWRSLGAWYWLTHQRLVVVHGDTARLYGGLCLPELSP